MSLVPFDANYRRMWMFPRNIRRISPWKVAQIISIMRCVVDSTSWSGRQEVQNSFCKALEAAGLKNPGEQYDPHSGGPRTYFAQLKCLGLIFQRTDKQIFYTLAGEDLASGKPPLPILQDLLLKHQYPSCYGYLSNIRMHPKIKVKPILFVLRLLMHPNIGSMSVQELIIPVTYGHNNDCFDLCVEKILKFRQTCNISSVIDNYKKDFYTRRTHRNNFDSRLKDANYIANTLKNWLQAACLIVCDRVGGEQHISISQSAEKKIKAALNTENEFIPFDSEEAFQRRFGCVGVKKDTRSLNGEKKKEIPEKSIISSKFYEYMGNNVIDEYPEDFVSMMYHRLGIPEKLTRKVIEPLLSKSLSFFESTYLELASGGKKTAWDFEKATSQILSSKLKFESRLTGQTKRRGSAIGGYSDIFVIAIDGVHCGIIDTKASRCYSLSSSDYLAMLSNYIPNYKELAEGRPLKLEFCSYIAGGFGSIDSQLRQLTEKTGIGASALPALELLRVAACADGADSQPLIREALKRNKVLTLKDFKLHE